jgi:hypothetical protein
MDFAKVFDVLFTHGEFAATYTADHGERDCMRFVDDLETPLNDLGIQAICACRLMQLLPHPGYAVLMLVSAHHKKDPVFELTKALAARCCLRVFDPRVIVHAMRIFVPSKRPGAMVWEGFPVSDMFITRTRREWVAFAEARCSDRLFLQRWWWACPVTQGGIREAIAAAAEKERASLSARLYARDRLALIEEKTREAELKRKVEEVVVVKRKTPEVVVKGDEPAAKRRKPRPVVVTKKDELALVEAAAGHEARLLRVVSKLEHVLVKKRVCKIGAKLAAIVGALARMHPLIEWSLKDAVHEAAVGRSAFATERKLFAHRLDLVMGAAVMEQLEKMV